MTNTVAKLLGEVAELHHRVYAIVDGNDPDWASWYADWLINLSDLPKLLKITPVRSELVYLLVKLNKAYTKEKPAIPWQQYYADRLIEYYSDQKEEHA